MLHEFSESAQEPEPESSFAHGSGPPRKLTGIGTLDPPVPPKRPPGPIPQTPASLLFRIVAGVLLVALAIATIALLFVKL